MATDDELAAYLDWPVTVKVGGIWCEHERECPNPRCDGNGSTEIRAGIVLTPRELLTWIKKHAEVSDDAAEHEGKRGRYDS